RRRSAPDPAHRTASSQSGVTWVTESPQPQSVRLHRWRRIVGEGRWTVRPISRTSNLPACGQPAIAPAPGAASDTDAFASPDHFLAKSLRFAAVFANQVPPRQE